MSSAFRLIRTLTFTMLICVVAAIDFHECLEEIRSGKYGSVGGLDNNGHPVKDIKNATAITYRLCTTACGGRSASFDWITFSQQIGSWLLPWLALLPQLPFGADDHLTNLQSTILSVGSPVLAAYSLALTTLNARWTKNRFLFLKRHPNTPKIVQLLNTLQQAPLYVDGSSPLLVPLVGDPVNRGWWNKVLTSLRPTHSWSIAAAASIAWVVLAYIFTVVISFSGEIHSAFKGHAVGIIWLWLLPIVVGWLRIVPKCGSRQLRRALGCANALSFTDADGDSQEPPIGLMSSPTPSRRDECRSSPIFNYSRVFAWSQAVEIIAVTLGSSDSPPDSLPSSREAVSTSTEKPKEGNRYDVATSVSPSHPDPEHVLPRKASHWAPGVWRRILISALMGLFLQWGTTIGAVIVVWFTPTRGLGCQSTSFLVYGCTSTLAWLACISSSILSHYASYKPPSRISAMVESLSVFLRRAGKLLAGVNALGLIALSIFQFSMVFNNCYCNCTVIGRGPAKAYDVIDTDDRDISLMRHAWIGGEILAACAALSFIAFVKLLFNQDFPQEIDE